MLAVCFCVAGYTLLHLAHVRKLYDLLGHQWYWGSNSLSFYKAVFVAPVLEEFVFRLLCIGTVHHLYSLTSLELWEMVWVSSFVFAAGHDDRGFTLVMTHYLPVGIAYALIFILVSEIADVVYAYGVVMLLHAAYNFIVSVGPQRIRFLGR